MGEGRGTVLVVDDDQSIRDILTDFLGDLGFTVLEAPGGLEALGRIERDPPDVVLLDIRMPGMDGVETLRRIRHVNRAVPVLMITGNDDADTARETLRLGAFDCVSKPFDLSYLERAVHKMIAAGAATRPEGTAAVEPSSYGLAYDLALEVFRTTSRMSPRAHATLGTALEAAALGLAQRGSGADKGETVRGVNQIRMLIRFARDLGELSDDVHRQLEGHVVRARRSLGLS
jgi:CheY-like chemotaxis protein